MAFLVFGYHNSFYKEHKMNRNDREEFILYLHQCTDKQVYGVLEKEQGAGRQDYADLAIAELERRGLDLP
jgi:hypothetical protein